MSPISLRHPIWIRRVALVVRFLRDLTPLILGITALITIAVCVFAACGLIEELRTLYFFAVQSVAAIQFASWARVLGRWIARGNGPERQAP